MEKVKDIYIFDLNQKEDRSSFEEKYGRVYYKTGLVIETEKGDTILGCSSDVCIPFDFLK